jgi:hypothetical protein
VTEYTKGAVSVVNPQGTEETRNDGPAAPILLMRIMGNMEKLHKLSKLRREVAILRKVDNARS